MAAVTANENQCSICLEGYTQKEIDDELIVMHPGHVFHKDPCLSTWGKYSTACPLRCGIAIAPLSLPRRFFSTLNAHLRTSFDYAVGAPFRRINGAAARAVARIANSVGSKAAGIAARAGKGTRTAFLSTALISAIGMGASTVGSKGVAAGAAVASIASASIAAGGAAAALASALVASGASRIEESASGTAGESARISHEIAVRAVMDGVFAALSSAISIAAAAAAIIGA